MCAGARSPFPICRGSERCAWWPRRRTWMAGAGPAMTTWFCDHPFSLSCPGLARASTSSFFRGTSHMSETFLPAGTTDVVDAIRWAAAEGKPLDLHGHRSKAQLGHPVQTAYGLDMSRLHGVLDYEPAELTLTLRPGSLVSDIEKLLAGSNQMLAFEPPDLGPLWGGPSHRGTMGGAVSCNLAGPRRVKAGAARDQLLGFPAVSGRGEIFRAGGKVVKNVTGYDLPKLVCGAYGTLAALTEITVKVLPAPEKTRTALVFGLSDESAAQALSAAAQSPYEVSGLAH